MNVKLGWKLRLVDGIQHLHDFPQKEADCPWSLLRDSVKVPSVKYLLVFASEPENVVAWPRVVLSESQLVKECGIGLAATVKGEFKRLRLRARGPGTADAASKQTEPHS